MLLGGSTATGGAAAAGPFISASSGPQASSVVEATVTRLVDGVPVTLPAAVVPALRPGDRINVRFTDYLRPPGSVNYHVNVAFITEAAPQHWLFERSGPQDRLFAVPSRAHPHSIAPPVPDLRFTYGSGTQRGIPIFFIVPEDEKTRGMDGVRDYVDAHPTDFKDMAESANDAVDRYVWFHDFLNSLANGALVPYSSQQRIEDIATSLGAPAGSVQACYAAGGSQADIANCIGSAVSSAGYQTNLAAPTQAQFLGGAAGAALPLTMAAYLIPLVTIWKIFSSAGPQDYEYLPTSLNLATPPRPGMRSEELLMGLKVPTLRPPAAVSSALFFTIGDPQAAETAPAVVNDASDGGMCATANTTLVPIHLDRTSKYVNGTELIVRPDGGSPFAIPIDPHSLAAVTLDRSQLSGSTDGAYSLELSGRFGFSRLAQPLRPVARLALPRQTTWSLAEDPHSPPQTGGTLDIIASSPQAACLTAVDMQAGSASPVALTLTHLDDRRVALHASLAGIPAGTVALHFYQSGGPGARIETDTSLAVAPQPARVAASPPAVARIGDEALELEGTRLETIAAVRTGGKTYQKAGGSTSLNACFSGPPITGVSGQSVPAQLVPVDGSPGEAFSLLLAGRRPSLQAPEVVAPSPPLTQPWLSTEPLTVRLEAAAGTVAPTTKVRIRRAVAAASPCEAWQADNAAADVPAADVYESAPNRLMVTLRPEEELGSRAFGTLQVSLVDRSSGAHSKWADIPGSFARAPLVDAVDCPSDPKQPCTLVGRDLAAISAIQNATGGYVTPGLNCSTGVQGAECRSVPRVEHYVVRLTDTGGTLAIPDAKIAVDRDKTKDKDQATDPSPSPG